MIHVLTFLLLAANGADAGEPTQGAVVATPAMMTPTTTPAAAVPFAPFAQEFLRALTNNDGAWFLRHVEMPLPVVNQATTTTDGKSFRLDGAATIAFEDGQGGPGLLRWDQVGDCGDEEFTGVTPNIAGWVCDLVMVQALTSVGGWKLAVEPTTFAIATPGFRLDRPVQGMRLVFNPVPGSWKLVRVERVMYAE